MLPRLKPDPIPAVHPVPEFAASGRLSAVYERTKKGLGVPWMGVVTMAFAHYPTFYEKLWEAMEPVVCSTAFSDACAQLRDAAEQEAAALTPPGVIDRLQGLGYKPEELDHIRACNEVFSAGNMPYLLIATTARLLLEGKAWGGAGDLTAAAADPTEETAQTLIEPHHASPDLQAVYADLRGVLGLPFVNTDYRAFARWPSYFKLAWEDLKPVVQSDTYEPAVARVHDTAIALVSAMPNVTGITPENLRNAANTDATAEEVLEVVRLFQWLLPGLAVNVAFFREQLR